jgi:hypothetical protein
MAIKLNYSENVPKNLLPGTQEARIIRALLESPAYDSNASYVVLELEGPDMGADFEGFLIDKNDVEGPRYKGQVGRVKSARYPYSDGTTKTGRPVYKDQGVARFIASLCFELGPDAINWMQTSNEKFDSIEELVEDFNNMLQISGLTNNYYNFVISAKEYIKDGYTRNDMFFPKYEKGKVFIEKKDANPSKLINFDPNLHIIKAEVKPASNFESASGVTSDTAEDFDMSSTDSDLF